MIRSTAQHFRDGRCHGYPLCCVVQWCWDYYTRRRGMGIRRGSVKLRRADGTRKVWVPCSWHQGRHPNWRLHGRAFIFFDPPWRGTS